ncbi:hypothetical protein MNBD_GAMMA26-1229 [hydrothermal vent metagenome]|uniref:Cytochrome c domain-containing protein n=1 Tax=hydrothermal vent metagenome TaxID=652676 RepID=A0A3B1BD22_9ZZZZ
MNRTNITIAMLLLAIPFYAQADAVSTLEKQYSSQGAGNFSAAAGQKLWNQGFIDAKSGKERKCIICHTTDLTQAGKHERTGKVIKPMAPSVNPERLTDLKKIKKWFVRNCKWTIGRECTAQEKGDVLAYLKSL